MHLKSFCVFDEKAKAFLPPWFLPELGMAIRTFGDCVLDAEHQFGKHPGDYTLFHIGMWDSETGVFTPLKAIEAVTNGLELRSRLEVARVNGSAALASVK